MPNKYTFSVPVIKEFVLGYVRDGRKWADPFSGKSYIAEYRNDLNPENNQPSQVDATEFLSGFGDGALKGVIFDPPYSPTQVSRSYNDMGLKLKGKENPTGGFPKAKDEISRIVSPGGIVLSFGWNTGGMGINRSFQIEEIMIVCHGGNHNDTLCTAERRL